MGDFSDSRICRRYKRPIPTGKFLIVVSSIHKIKRPIPFLLAVSSILPFSFALSSRRQRFPFVNTSSIQFPSPFKSFSSHLFAAFSPFFFASVLLPYLLPLVLLAFEFCDIVVSPPTSTQSGTNSLLVFLVWLFICSFNVLRQNAGWSCFSRFSYYRSGGFGGWIMDTFEFIFSTTTDGKIKAWLYDNMGSRVDYDAPGHSSTTMSYSADGTRLFSCGTNKEGESFLVEWNESEGAVKRTYHGLGKRSAGVVQFDTTKNRFLAAGDEFTIKFWDMDNTSLLTSIDADGGLLASPCIRFNKEGILLAVSTSDNGVKILVNAEGIRLLRTVESRTFDASRVASAAAVKAPTIGAFPSTNAAVVTSLADRTPPVAAMVGLNNDSRSLVDVKPRIVDEAVEKSRIWKLTEINEPSQCHSLKLPDGLSSMRVSRLIYTNQGVAILALAANAVHKLWKWQKNDRNTSGKATASLQPQL
ncbi:topless-related protein [Trifolium repens]|nr:topless-related protein [Trifolium repens]